MIVGPSAIGKSTLMNRSVELDKDFARISGFTTRPKRDIDEPGLYSYIPHTDEGIQSLLSQKEAGELIQYVVHPTTGFIYGSYPADYPKLYNMKDTLSNVVASLSRLPFRRSHVIGLIADPKMWQAWFSKRNSPENEDYQKRINEAVMSLEWLIKQPKGSIDWVYNHPDDISKSSKELIALVRGDKKSDSSLREYGLEMLSLAQQMKEWHNRVDDDTDSKT